MPILDVRTADEARVGMIRGARLVADDELARRLAELPRDQRIVIHCGTGVRAAMAYHLLADAGYNAVFFNGTVSFDKDGALVLAPR